MHPPDQTPHDAHYGRRRAASGVEAKDVILYIISKLTASGGTGHFIEFAGSTIRSLSMEGRMTVCNMSIECGARGGMIAPDEKTFEYLRGRERAPQGASYDEAVARWRELYSDTDAVSTGSTASTPRTSPR